MTEYNSLCRLTNEKLQWKEIQRSGCWAEAPARGAGAAKWKIPAEDVFPFPMGEKEGVAGSWRFFGKFRKHKEDDKMTSLNSEKLSKQVVFANTPHSYSACV